eukprot:365377-Chlamydomonas_euryale.AAC.52
MGGRSNVDTSTSRVATLSAALRSAGRQAGERACGRRGRAGERVVCVRGNGMTGLPRNAVNRSRLVGLVL